MNSRGGFFSAADPETFSNQLSSVLQSIVARVEGSGAAAAASSAILQSDSLLYAASFRSNDWSGNLVARELSPTTGLPGAIRWNAEQRLSDRSAAAVVPARNLVTSNGSGSGVDLTWSSISQAQRDALAINPPGALPATPTGENRLNWLRGADVAGLRSRVVDGVTRRIGDLVSSDPYFMTRRDFGNSLLGGDEGSRYLAFRNSTAYRNRPDVLFVGSNGGMLHAFHAGTPFVSNGALPPAQVIDPNGGNELFAYVPSELLLAGASGSHAQINELMRTDYRTNRRYFVDGSPAVADAYLGPTDPKVWKTVLVGSMGAGGRTVFALDVTNPAAFDAGKVLWEFGYANVPCVTGLTTGSRACRDMGYGVTQPKITRLRDGRWVAIFGNGYNSFENKAKLFVVDLETGRLLHLLDTNVGSSSVPNGLGAPDVTDWPSADLSVSRVYAGDLRGNVWRFDLSNTASPQVARLVHCHRSVRSGAAHHGQAQRCTLAHRPHACGGDGRHGELLPCWRQFAIAFSDTDSVRCF